MRQSSPPGAIASLLASIDREGAKATSSLGAVGIEPPALVLDALAPIGPEVMEELREGRGADMDGDAFSDAIGWLTTAAGRAQADGEAARAALADLRSEGSAWADPTFLGILGAGWVVVLALALTARYRLLHLAARGDGERRALSRRTAQLESLLEVIRAASSAPDQAAIATTVAEQARVVAGGEFAFVALADGGVLHPIARAGDVAVADAPAASGMLGRVLDTGSSSRATVLDEPALPHERELVSLVAAPLVVDRHVAGVVCVGQRRTEPFGEEEQLALQLLAAGGASALETAWLRESSAELAELDALTGLYNRRRLERDVHSVTATCAAEGRPVSALMIDLDHFKRLNDTEGHGAGDDALRRVAGIVRACVRARDTVYRYGGEELVALLPEAHLADALAVAERIRAGVALDARPGGRGLTVSIGAAVTVEADGDALVSAADAALYRAKSEGRNRVRAAA
jgi:diguanylate cyclase (GGDEF)-like protein